MSTWCLSGVQILYMGLVISIPEFSGENVLGWRVTVSMNSLMCSDWEKQHFVMVFHSRLKRIFTTMCFLVLVGIEQGLPFKGIPAKFTTITTQHPPIYLNLTGEIQMLSLLAQCSGTSNTVILVFAPCSYLRLTNSQQANSGWQIHSRMSWSLCCLSLKLL